MKKIRIAPSILSADFSRLEKEIKTVERGGADMLHIDVMDGQFVPNITIGPVVISWIRKRTKLPLDVHLMIDDPLRYVKAFRDAGSDWITVHYEACTNLSETLKAIRKLNAKVGISLNPKTPVTRDVMRYVRQCDLVLIMSVQPGFGGQSFMPEVLPKISTIRKGFTGLISIDGGITPETAPQARACGVDILVAGSSVFGQKNRSCAIQKLRGENKKRNR